MLHTLAYNDSVAAVTNDDIPALTDGIFTIQNGHFLPQRDYDLVFAFVSGLLVTTARLVSPANRQITLPFLRPFNLADLAANDPNTIDLRENPFRIRGLEELAVEVSTSGAGPSEINVLLGLSNGFEPVPRGNIFTLRGTSVTAAVASAWTPIAVTWADALPSGKYICCGVEHFSVSAVAARLQFEGQFEQPGFPSVVLRANRQYQGFYGGGFGVIGRFDAQRMPNVQVLCNTTDNAHDVYLQILKVG